MLQIELLGESLVLLPEKAIFWPVQKALIVADLHWGKTGHFRKNGIAIPVTTQLQDEIRLATIIRKHKAERLIIAGDLFHSRQNNEVDSFLHWRTAHASLQIDLVTGNHDILPQEKYAEWAFNLYDNGLSIGPFLISHDCIDTDLFCIHGHIHPAVRLMQNKHLGIKLPCYCQSANKMILPAFGDFTGSKLQNMNEHQHIYVITESEVIQWK